MTNVSDIFRAQESPTHQVLLEESHQRATVPLSSRERWAEALVGAGFVAVVALLLTTAEPQPFPFWEAIALTVAFAAVSTVQFDVGSCYTVPSQLVLVPMLFVLPPATVPLWVVAALLLSKLPDHLRRRRPLSRIWLSLGDSWFAVGPAAVLVLAGAPSAAGVGLPVLLAAVTAQFAVDFAASACRLLITQGRVLRAHVEESAWIYAVDLLLWPIGFVAAVADDARSGAALGVLGLAVLLRLFAYERTARMNSMLELSHAYRGTAVLLGDVVEADHEYTGSHSRGVVEYSTAVADVLHLDPAQRRRVEFGALLHDVGKVRIPKEIIDKPGPLDDEEWAVMRRHTIEGEAMLRQVGGTLADVGRIVRASHERVDGRGYPDGLAGADIPIEARIVTCCDAYSAMTTNRAYRQALDASAAVAELRACSGTHFDAQVVDALISVLDYDRNAPAYLSHGQAHTVPA